MVLDRISTSLRASAFPRRVAPGLCRNCVPPNRRGRMECRVSTDTHGPRATKRARGGYRRFSPSRGLPERSVDRAQVMARRVRWDSLCCPVTSAGQASMELAGFRALPPVETASLVGTDYDLDAKEDLHALLHESSQSAAVVCFMMGGRDCWTSSTSASWSLEGLDGSDWQHQSQPTGAGRDRRAPRRSLGIRLRPRSGGGLRDTSS
jgi:hypothetical protein